MPTISSKMQTHIQTSLWASGLAILEQRLMVYLRPDLWATAQNLAADSHWGAIENYLAGLRPRVKLYEILFAGQGTWARVAARSDDRLAERVGWISGLEVAEVRPYQAEERAAEPAPRPTAADEIPAWGCAARTLALEKQREREKHDRSRSS